MKLHKITILLALLTVNSLLFTSSAFAEGIAILDIDRAAKELNVEANVKATLEKMQTELQTELAASQKQLRSQMESMTSLVGPNPTNDQRQRLMAQLRLLEAEFNQARTQAMQKIQAKQGEMIKEFTNKIKPLAMAQAKRIKRDAVVLKANVFDYDEDIDITDATIKAAVKAGLKMPEVPKS